MRAKSAYRLPTGDIARKWQGLAERRRAYLVELYRSGRWHRCYDEEAFRHQLNEAMAELAAWEALAKEEDPQEIQAAQADALEGGAMHAALHDSTGDPSG